MKSLIIGIDGGDEKIFRQLKLKNLIKIFDDYHKRTIKENLWDRGWASILCGKEGMSTGAFYNKPKLDSTFAFTQSFGTKDYDKNQKISPLWSLVENAGFSGGFMNIPTTMPSPKQKSGFFVSGAGGGVGSLSKYDIPEKACNNSSVLKRLQELEYIMDIRFLSSGILDKDKLIEELISMTELRTKCFNEMSKEGKIDFGFIAFMSTSRIQNLAMSEIKNLIENDLVPQNSFQKGIYDLYLTLDNCVKELIESNSPQYITLVSDHGATEYKYSVNIDALLKKHGYFNNNVSTGSSLKRLVKRIYQMVLPSSTRKRITKKVPQTLRKKDIDGQASRAFGARYISGIYINDDRFQGKSLSDDQYQTLVEELVRLVNSDEVLKKHKISARPYRSEHKDFEFQSLLPDVWLDKPDEFFFEGKGKLIEENKNYGLIGSLGKVDRDMFTGVKGSSPIFFSTDARINSDLGSANLCACYNLIKQQIEE